MKEEKDRKPKPQVDKEKKDNIPTGEAESLVGKIDFAFGDKAKRNLDDPELKRLKEKQQSSKQDILKSKSSKVSRQFESLEISEGLSY